VVGFFGVVYRHLEYSDQLHDPFVRESCQPRQLMAMVHW
jgi:hypothetical protein